MTHRPTLRHVSESLRGILTRRGLSEPEAWARMVRLVTAHPARGPAHKADEVAALLADPSVRAALDTPLALGWLHQYWVNADKAEVAARLKQKSGDTIGQAELVAATCVYTPESIVRFLLQNAMLPLWAKGDSGALVGSTRTVSPAPGDGGASVQNLTILDPACGTGHFLVEAFELLFRMYRHELPRRSARWICRRIVHEQLFGLDIDSRAIAIARRTIEMTAHRLCGEAVRPANILLAPGIGSLRRPSAAPRTRVDRLLSRTYSVVAMNPPYVGFRKLAPEIKRCMTDPLAASDLALAFLSRGFDLVEPGGMLASVTPAAWLTSTPALPLRRQLIDHGRPRLIATLGQHVFETAPLLFVALSIIQRPDSPDPHRASGVIMIESRGDSDLARAAKQPRTISLSRIRADPHRSLAPSSALISGLARREVARVADFFAFADGVWTGDTARDTRRLDDVDPDDPAWTPASAGHGYCRWYARAHRVLRAAAAARWPHLDRRIGSLEYSRVAGGRLAARMVSEPTVPVAGVVTMMPRRGEKGRREDVLAVFNSRVGTLLLRSLTSGLNFNPGYAARVPLPADGLPEATRRLVREAVALQKALAPAVSAISPDAMSQLALQRRLHAVERAIDEATADALGVRQADLQTIILPPASMYEKCVREGRTEPEIEEVFARFRFPTGSRSGTHAAMAPP